LYWGSHNQYIGEATFTTFGDHDALPRFGLPDMFWSPRRALSSFEEKPEWQAAGGSLISAYMEGALEDAARVMFSLQSEDLSFAMLQAETGIAVKKLEKLLTLLETAEYVARDDDHFVSTAVVLTSDEEKMIHDMLRHGREITIEWHENNYETVKRNLLDLTPLRYGVPFGTVYTEVWHFIFGIANRILVEEGLFCDPYSADRLIKGFVPAVWADGLGEFPG
jgi:hypothetical protein